MKNKQVKIIGAVLIVSILIISASAIVLLLKETEKIKKLDEMLILPVGVKCYTKTFNFSEPIVNENQDLISINIKETDFQSMGDGRPVLPTNLTAIEFPFGTKILEFKYEYSTPEIIKISKKISYASCSTVTQEDQKIYQSSEMYPSKFVSYHIGGGLSKNGHKTFLNIRVNPVTYIPVKDEIQFIKNAKVEVLYKEPETPLLENQDQYDLLIITPKKFNKPLKPLINHKEKHNIKTKLITVGKINSESQGRDLAEKIKYYIKQSIEELGIKSVLLVGGIDGQSTKWNLPIRYSHVLIREGTQEKLEPSFISDIYFADIYDSEGNFSSWDTNQNNIFAEYDGKIMDQMDLYPDVQLGRLPCRNKREVRIVVDKIIKYEKNKANENWFKRMILISGDHWKDPDQIAEGILIMEEATEIMSGFNPVKLYATKKNMLLVRDINRAINKGAGFAYFCGHGGPTSWGIHYPPNAEGWAPTLTRLKILTFYNTLHMNFLRNKNKLPVTIVGGCFNGRFDISIGKSIKKGKLKLTNANCWAWKLTSKKRGGSIATIANTGLGTHAMSDSDYNGINDYLEAYDGWLELKFLKLYSHENIEILGQLHQEAITNYLKTFLGNNDEMDPKMVQQWQLFGDPTLNIGGI